MDIKSLMGVMKKEIEELKEWEFYENIVQRHFEFKNHIDAVKFVEALSLEAISRELFPEIRISFQKVNVIFVNEDEKRFFKNIDFAKKIEEFCDCYNLK